MSNGDLWFFDRVAPLYHRLMPSAKRSSLETGIEQADLEVNRILDLAGGTGRSAVTIRNLRPIVVDASRPMLDQVPPALSTIQGSATHLPIRSETVDVVTIVDAFHHLPSKSTVIAEVVRVLRSNGVIIVRDFDPSSIRGRMIAGMEHLLRMRSRFVTVPDLTSELDAAGLEPRVFESGFVYTVVGRKPGYQ